MKKYARYTLYLALFLVLDLALDRRLVFWEWTFLSNWFGNAFAPARIGLYASALAASVGMLQLAMTKNIVARILVSACGTVSLSFLAFFMIIEERMPDLTDVAISFDGLADFTRVGITVFQTYTRTTVFALIAGGLITAELMLIGRRAAKQPRPVPAWLALVLLCGSIVFCSRLDSAGRSAPLYVKTPALVLRSLTHSYITLYRGPRAAPELEPADAGRFRSHILVIMDESAAGFALGVNGCTYDTTPFLSSRTGPYFNNYGIASSGGNYSSISNFLFISGLQPEQIPDYSQVSLRQASIFGYAKKAGRRTFYVDAQNTRLKNMLTASDLLDMEYVSTLDETLPLYQQDRIGMRKVVAIMRSSPEPTFVFLLKTGLHTPFPDKFPSQSIRRPGWGAKSPLVEEFFNGITWAVDDFFKELADQLRGLDVIVVYTSDHGLSIDLKAPPEEHYKLFYATRNTPSPLQLSVPLFVWPMSERALEEYSRAGGFNPAVFNRTTHFQLFPTLLTLMGYERGAVRARFGDTLFDPPPARRVFTTRNFLGERGTIDGEATWLYPFE